jgi:nucleosome binding factor SPN SPT16 subunit
MLTLGNKRQASIMVADTVIVTKEGPLNATDSLAKKYDDIGYSLNNEGESDMEEAKPQRQTNMVGEKAENGGVQTRATRRGRSCTDKSANWTAIREHQTMLLDKLHEEIKERLASGNFIFKGSNKAEQHLEKIQTYSNPSKVPKNLPKNRITLDKVNDCVILPVNGQLVPFHVSVIKNINKQQDGRISSLRFNFNIPGSGITSMIFPDPKTSDYLPIYIKEMTFRSVRGEHFNNLMRDIKEMQKILKIKESELDNQGPSEDLILTKGRKPALQDLKLRPTLSGRKTVGTLECHQNGFRFYTRKNEKLDVLFNNIKHAFFQPCDQEIII